MLQGVGLTVTGLLPVIHLTIAMVRLWRG